MTALLPCPWCGQTPEKLMLSEGNTYRWAIVTPSCCGDINGEIRRQPYPDPLGEADMARAVEWWNGRHPKTEVTR